MSDLPRVVPSVRLVLRGIVVGLFAAIVLGLVVLWPRGELDLHQAEVPLTRGEFVRGTVESVDEGPCSAAVPDQDPAPMCVLATVRLEEGPDEGTSVPLELATALGPVDLDVGDGLILEAPPASAPDAPYGLYDRVRTPALLWLTILFVGLVIVIGRLRGLGALVGLGVSLFLLVRFALPAILHGSPPWLVAAVTAGLTAYVVIFLAHGFSDLVDVALLGTLGGVALALLLGTLWVPFAELTGLASEAASIVRVLGLDVDLGGLLLAGVVIGALGAIDDVAVTQASAVRELRASGITDGEQLFAAGMRVGRDHVGSIVNTLVLAYAGASLPLLIVYELSGTPLSQVLTGELVATEIVRALIGSIGLLAAMPFTTWLASMVYGTTASPVANAVVQE